MKVAVIGAGWAGLSCAVELTRLGAQVELIEAGRQAGGRARRVDIEGRALDNGQHILLGAYTETLALMRTVGADPDRRLRRLPLDLSHADGFRLRVPELPLPYRLRLALGMLRATRMRWHDRLALLRFMRSVPETARAPDQPVAEWLARCQQPDSLIRHLWAPLCVSALNTPPALASSRIFAAVLRDALLGPADHADLLLPGADLGRLLPDPALEWLAARGQSVRRACRIAAIHSTHDGVRLAHPLGHVEADHAVIAVAPHHAPALLDGVPALAPLANTLRRLEFEPITTLYFGFPPGIHLPRAMTGFAEGIPHWVFDRGRLDGQSGVLACVISAGGPHAELTREALAAQVLEALRCVQPDLPQPAWTRQIVERQATYRCTPGLARPDVATADPRLWLCGDYTAGDYPATLEAAVRSGQQAARALMGRRSGHRPRS